MTDGTPPLDDAGIEALLRARYRAQAADADAEHADLETVARLFDGDASAEERARAQAALDADPTLSEAFATLRDADGEQKVVSFAAARTARESRRARQPGRAWYGAIAAAIIATIGIIAYTTTGPGPGRDGASIGAGFGAAGAGDRLTLQVVDPQDGARALAPDAVPGPDDALAWEVTAVMPGHVALFQVQSSGAVHLLNKPAEAGASHAIDKGVSAPPPGRDRLVEGAGCQWVVAVFSNQAFAVRDASAALAGAPRDAATCRLGPLEPALPWARTITHTLVRR